MDVLFLDSADLTEVREAAESGIVAGVTTNPTLLQQAADGRDAVEHLRKLIEVMPDGQFFFQLHARNKASAWTQANRAREQAGDAAGQLVFKLPAQPTWYSLGAELIGAGYRVAFTAVYQPGQVLAAVQTGAHFVIPYVDRARRLRPQHQDFLGDLRAVAGQRIEILAASIKSSEQAVIALRSGAHAITAPWQVLQGLMLDELTDTAVQEFHAAAPL